MGSFSIWHWLVVLLVVVMVFGTRKLKDVGTDLGAAVRGFREGLRDTNPDRHPETPPRSEPIAHASADNPPKAPDSARR